MYTLARTIIFTLIITPHVIFSMSSEEERRKQNTRPKWHKCLYINLADRLEGASPVAQLAFYTSVNDPEYVIPDRDTLQALQELKLVQKNRTKVDYMIRRVFQE